MVLDPRSMLAYFLLGIKSYLSLAALANLIDPRQPIFNLFIEGEPQALFTFLLSQYELIVNGLVKSDMPSNADLTAFLGATSGLSADLALEFHPSQQAAGAPLIPPYAGFAWNGVYGVVDQYPKYGAYLPSTPVAIPASSPSCLIDLINTNNLLGELIPGAATPGYLGQATLVDWIFPWAEDKLILGRMARWKAIYLINGYDKVWSILQNLYTLANPNQPALPALTLSQDGTIANGNWSARELCTTLNLHGYIAGFLPGGSLITTVAGVKGGPQIIGYSLFGLVQVLDTVATGDWLGPGGYQVPTGPPLRVQGLSRPAGFRERLAAAAV
jgi:hypothetical protein